ISSFSVERRKACRACPGLRNPSVCVDGMYDSDQIGPWSRWQGTLDSQRLIVGQDWGDEEYFRQKRGRDSKSPERHSWRSGRTLRALYQARARLVRASALLTMMVAPCLLAQAPSGVNFTLATKDAKSTFRVGEAVEVEFRFTSTTPGAYGAWTLRSERQVRQAEYDHFTIEPAEGVADPLWDIVAQMPGGGIGGRLPAPVPL